MAKFLKNTGKAVISFGNKDFIPGTKPVEVTDAELSNPMIKAYIKAKKLEIVESAAMPSAMQAETPELETMSNQQLKNYAAEKGINLGDARSKDDILAMIKAEINKPTASIY